MTIYKLRIGIIGAGGIMRSHLPRLKERVDAVEVRAVTDLNPQAAQAMAEEFCIPCHTTDFREWLPEVDAVLVAIPTHLHHTVGMEVARAGKALFMEKPLTRTLEQARAVLNAVTESGTPLQVGFVRRFDEHWLGWRDLVQQERIGRPVVWRDATNGWGPKSAWFLADEMGGGPFLDGCIHSYDFALHTFGPAEWVFAHLRTMRTDTSALDTGTVTIRFQSGDELMLACSWGLPRGVGGHRTFEFLGPAGALQFSATGDYRLLRSIGGLEPEVHTIPRPECGLKEAFARQMDEFIAVANRQTLPRAGGTEGLRALELALAVLESGRSGEVVRLA